MTRLALFFPVERVHCAPRRSVFVHVALLENDVCLSLAILPSVSPASRKEKPAWVLQGWCCLALLRPRKDRSFQTLRLYVHSMYLQASAGITLAYVVPFSCVFLIRACTHDTQCGFSSFLSIFLSDRRIASGGLSLLRPKKSLCIYTAGCSAAECSCR